MLSILSISGLEKLHVKFMTGIHSGELIAGRRYTLTHADFSGNLFLPIGIEFDR